VSEAEIMRAMQAFFAASQETQMRCLRRLLEDYDRGGDPLNVGSGAKNPGVLPDLPLPVVGLR
jgi:hypothetical protein